MTAVATRNPIHGGLFLLAFGLGTIPTMWTVGAVVGQLTVPQRLGMQRAFAIVVAGWGAFPVLHGIHALVMG